MKRFLHFSLPTILYVLTFAHGVVGGSARHGLGCILLPREEYNKIDRAAIPRSLTPAAAQVLTLNCPPVGDQGQQGSCTAFGHAYGARSISMYDTSRGPWNTVSTIFSPAYVYNQLKTTCDGGITVPSALNLLESQGSCREGFMPYADTDCATLPNSFQQEDAGFWKIGSFSRVGISVDSIKSLLIANSAVIVAGPVDDNFELLGTGGVLRNFGTYQGAHCYCVVGYDDIKQAFKFENSWGTSWGTAGFGYIGYTYINQWWQEAYVIHEGSWLPPGQASNPGPANYATSISTTPLFSWKAGCGPYGHEIYFGIVNPPPYCAGDTYNHEPNASLPAGQALSCSTTYYWRINEWNVNPLTQQTSKDIGPVWSFTTGASTNTVPGAPTGASAIAGNGQVTITFNPPASNGGSPITSYTVTSSPGSISAFAAASPITVGNLSNGVSYTFTVTATNAMGIGPASTASNSATTSFLPIGIKANGSSGSITIKTADALTLALSVDPQTYTGTPVDFWIAGSVNGLYYFYQYPSGNWSTNQQVTYQGPLSALDNLALPSMTNIPPGTYIFYFAIDQQDGVLQLPPTAFSILSTVQVTVTP